VFICGEISLSIELQNFSWLTAAILFVALGAAIVLLGFWSLAGLGSARQWVSIGVRLVVILLLILILGGARLQPKHDALEVMIVEDQSASVIDLVGDYPGRGQGVSSLRQALNQYYANLAADPAKERKDPVGLVRFGRYARVDVLPNEKFQIGALGSWDKDRDGGGTDISAGLQLALASLSHDAMHRLVLVSDGNSNLGDWMPVVDAAKAQGVPIDVVPLKYNVQNDVMVQRLIAPEWKRENEPFDLAVGLVSTNRTPVTGTLKVEHIMAGKRVYLDMDPAKPGSSSRKVTIEPGSASEPGHSTQYVRVPPQTSSGVHRFKATFTPDDPAAEGSVSVVNAIGKNDSAETYTFVEGEGQMLFVDGTIRPGSPESYGDMLFNKLNELYLAEARKNAAAKGLKPGDKMYEPIRRISVGEFPHNLTELQNYNAVILYNVSHGGASENGPVAGLDNDQDRLLNTYVHDMGGGLLMIGGPDSFGAGGWTGTETEKILPVDMEIPAQRNVGKGALVLVIHSCEMPKGNFWGEQCAIEAVKTLSVRDEVGVISYGSGVNPNQGIGGANWDRPLKEVGNKADVIDAIKKMMPGDMPSFDDTLNLALNGAGGTMGLRKSTAQNKHIIIISDGDPTAPQQPLLQACKDLKISISTITVYPHIPGTKTRPDVMEKMAKETKGRAYGPIEDNPGQLPQIFIKEAQVVKRSLIQDNKDIVLSTIEKSDPIIQALSSNDLPPLRGMVLTSRKKDLNVRMPLATGPLKDPILAYWQTGLGHSAVWTSDAHNLWAPAWVSSPHYGPLFVRILEEIQRPMQSDKFEVTTTIKGDRGEIVVTAFDDKGGFRSFLSMTANVVGGDDLKNPQQIRLEQTGPGRYSGTFRASDPGAYVAVVSWASKSDGGILRTGQVKNGSPETQDLKSNEAILKEIATRTGGRVLPAFDASHNIFSRLNVSPGYSMKPIWETLLPWLLALIILDVAVRRIAWDWQSIKRMAHASANYVRSFTTTRQVAAEPTLDALRKVRTDVAEQRQKASEAGQPATTAGGPPPMPTGARPDPKAKFVASSQAVEGDLTKVVGGATNKPLPSAPKNVQPKGAPAGPGGHLGGLMAAKKRAQQQIKEKEQEGGTS
jgi:uncharacterized membrane protein/Mg-chelatase subunit ChlD